MQIMSVLASMPVLMALVRQKATGLDDEVLNCVVLPCCSLTGVPFTAEKQRDGMSHTLVQTQCFLPLMVSHILCLEVLSPCFDHVQDEMIWG
jgi:hypothetical protein